MHKVDTDHLSRTALLRLHQPGLSVDAALQRHRATAITLTAGPDVCATRAGQAALLTAVATAVRAFGTTFVTADRLDIVILGGPDKGRLLADVIRAEGVLITSPADTSTPPAPRTTARASRSVSIGAAATGGPIPELTATWSGWQATVSALDASAHARTAYLDTSATLPSSDDHVIAAIAAGALGVAEAFLRDLDEPGSDAGHRALTLDLWSPSGQHHESAPALRYAPSRWWLLGLGHLGQAFAHTIAWLNYDDPGSVEVVLQDTEHTVPANHSTGILTPAGSHGVPKTRLVAAALEAAGVRTVIVERRAGPRTRREPDDMHVALIGVDNLATRRLISGVGWESAVDVGLGASATDFEGITLRRFPGSIPSDKVESWKMQTAPVALPNSRAFHELAAADTCGAVHLAGRAVGVSFVGVIAAALAVAETVRDLHGGSGNAIVAVSLRSGNVEAATTDSAMPAVPAPLSTQYGAHCPAGREGPGRPAV